MVLPTNRTAANTIEEHTADHNTLAAQHNELEGHADATADVHGIADTSVLALSSHDHDADYEPLGVAAAAAAALVDAAPATLDTLNELAAALGDDANFASTVTTALAGKSATGHSHAESDVTSLVSDLAGKAATGHDHSGAYVPVPAGAPTPGQILSATDDDPLTTDWIDAPGGGGAVAAGRPKSASVTTLSVPGVSLLDINTVVMSENVLRFQPFLVDTPITVDQIVFEVTTAATDFGTKEARVGIYAADTDWQPTTLLVDSGALATNSPGIKTASISLALTAGRYLMAWINGSNPAVRRLRGSSLAGIHPSLGATPYIQTFAVNQTYGALPSSTAWDTITTTGSSGGFIYVTFLRVSTP